MSPASDERRAQMRRERSRPLRRLTDDELYAIEALSVATGILRPEIADAVQSVAGLASGELGDRSVDPGSASGVRPEDRQIATALDRIDAALHALDETDGRAAATAAVATARRILEERS